MNEVVEFKPTKAEFSHKKNILDLMELIKKEVENDEVSSIVILTINSSSQWVTHMTGEISKLQLIGLLESAKQTVLHAARS